MDPDPGKGQQSGPPATGDAEHLPCPPGKEDRQREQRHKLGRDDEVRLPKGTNEHAQTERDQWQERYYGRDRGKTPSKF
jgi:hypothetical protein